MLERLPLMSLLIALPVLGVGAGAARADVCSSCPAPSSAEIESQPDFPSELPNGFYADGVAAECTYALTGPPLIKQGPSWLVLRGAGEVWNCPESSSEDTVTIEVAEGDSTSWTLSAEVSAGIRAVAFEAAVKVSTGVGGGRTTTEVKRVTKTIRAAEGHRIPWEGYFELADFTMEMDLAVTRRWSWWVKSVFTGDVVLVSGSVFKECGTEHLTLTRRGSIGYKFRLGDAPCGAGPATTPTDLGWWPLPLPPPPVTTPGSDPLPPPPAPTPPPPVTLDDPDPYPESSEELGEAPTGPCPYPPPNTDPIA